MACFNIALVISSLTLASHGFFVNNTATEHQVTSPLEQYPAGSATESPELLEILNDIFGAPPTTSEFPPRNATIESNASLKKPNENEIPHQLENDPPPLLDDKMKDRISVLFAQKSPVEYKNSEGDLDTTHTNGGKTLGLRIGKIPPPSSYENVFVNYDFDALYEEEEKMNSVKNNEIPGKLDTDTIARAAAAKKIDYVDDIGAADYIPPFLLGPSTTSTVTPITSSSVTTTEKFIEYIDFAAVDYLPPHLRKPKTINTNVTPKVPNRINIGSTGTSQNVPTTPADTTESGENGYTVTLSSKEEEEDTECKQVLPPINRAGRRVSDIKCEEHMNHLKYEIIDRKECLRSKGYSEVIGGTQSAEGDFPHMGAVGWSLSENSWVYLCGSSLISSRFSLTAAHCMTIGRRGSVANVTDLTPKVVRFGSVFLANNEGVIIMKIKDYIVTDEYKNHFHLKYNDIALIKFFKDVPISMFVRPACLWDGYLRGHLIGNVTGWGLTQSDKLESKSQHLLHAELDYYSKATCFNMLDHRKNRLWEKGLIDSQFCSGKLTGIVDTCQGDSGGPHQIQAPHPMHSDVQMYYVVGITSFGVNKCGNVGIPGIYTNVTQFLCWIEKTVWPEEKNLMCT